MCYLTQALSDFLFGNIVFTALTSLVVISKPNNIIERTKTSTSIQPYLSLLMQTHLCTEIYALLKGFFSLLYNFFLKYLGRFKFAHLYKSSEIEWLIQANTSLEVCWSVLILNYYLCSSSNKILQIPFFKAIILM